MSSFACCFGVSRLKSGLHASPICSTAWEYRERVVLWPREQAIEGAHCLRLKEPSAPQSLHLAKRRKLIACISAWHNVCASVQELVATLKCSRNPVLRCRFAYDFQMLSVCLQAGTRQTLCPERSVVLYVEARRTEEPFRASVMAVDGLVSVIRDSGNSGGERKRNTIKGDALSSERVGRCFSPQAPILRFVASEVGCLGCSSAGRLTGTASSRVLRPCAKSPRLW